MANPPFFSFFGFYILIRLKSPKSFNISKKIKKIFLFTNFRENANKKTLCGFCRRYE